MSYPTHPRTGLTALGFRRNGEPIWPIRGGSEDAPPAESTDVDTPPAESTSPDTGDKDWQAEAEKWKAFSRKHEEQAKANADKAKRLDEIEEASKTELDKAIARAEKAEQERTEIEARATRAEVAAAKGVPAELLTGANREELETSADALIAFRGVQPRPDFGAGKRGDDTSGGKPQLTRDEVNRLYAERKYTEIDQAREEGRLDSLLAGKS